MMMNKTDGKCLNLVISKRKMMLSIEWHNHIQRKRTECPQIRAVEDFVSRASSEKVFKQDGGCTVCSRCEVAAFEC